MTASIVVKSIKRIGSHLKLLSRFPMPREYVDKSSSAAEGEISDDAWATVLFTAFLVILILAMISISFNVYQWWQRSNQNDVKRADRLHEKGCSTGETRKWQWSRVERVRYISPCPITGKRLSARSVKHATRDGPESEIDLTNYLVSLFSSGRWNEIKIYLESQFGEALQLQLKPRRSVSDIRAVKVRTLLCDGTVELLHASTTSYKPSCFSVPEVDKPSYWYFDGR